MTDLSRLLNPKSVALIGGAWTKNVQAQLARMNFTGEVYHVHPRGTFKTVEDLPVSPDAAFIAVNRTAAVEVTKALAKKGAGGAICFASGFEEAGDEGANLQSALLQATHLDTGGTMPLLGPNCYGMVNYLDGVALWPDVHGGRKVAAGVALITQSSNVLINMSMQQRGLPIAYLLAAGNGAQIGLPDLIQVMDRDPRVTAIGLHIEGFGDAAAFHQACRACSKPLIALKAGETEAAQALTVSHTASLSGSDEVASAFLTRCGVGRVRSLEGFMEALKVLHLGGSLKEKTLASVSCSGGEASLMADFGARFGFEFPDLQGLGISDTLHPLVQESNPFDYHTFDWGDRAALLPAFTKVMTGPQELTLFVIDWPRENTGDVSGFDLAIDCMIRAQQDASAQQGAHARVAVLATYPENMPEDLANRLMSAGLVPLSGLQAGMEGLAAAALPTAQDYHHLCPPTGARHTLDEVAAKAMLARAGVSVPAGVVWHDGDARTDSQPPYPTRVYPTSSSALVMKAVDANLAHKSDVGGVVLNVQDVEATFEQLKHLSPTVLVEEMVTDAVAELIVGLAYDPVVGGHLLIGAGGTLTEVLDDTAILLFPFDHQQALKALKTLKVNKLLGGYRGKPAADKTALAKTLSAIQICCVQGHMWELDINPLMLTPSRAVAADALLVLGDSPNEPESNPTQP